MNYLQSMIAYFCVFYPHSNELSKARMTKLIYLADWFSALLRNRQMTNIHWVFNHYGPYVDDVIDSIRYRDDFELLRLDNLYGAAKEVVCFRGDQRSIHLHADDKKVLDWIIAKTQPMYFNEFIDFVYSTYPVASNERYSTFNLLDLAQEYRRSVQH